MIPIRRDAFIFVSTFKTQPESNGEIVALVSELAHVFFCRQAGYLSSAVHASLDGERVVNYSQWDSEQSYRNAVAHAVKDPGAMKFLRILEHLATIEPRYYLVSDQLPEDNTTIALGTDRATLINIFKLHNPESQQALVDVLRETTAVLSKKNCGLLSSSLHVSLDGKAVANYAQWESADAFEAAMQLPVLRKLLRQHVELSEPDVHFYDVKEVIPKPTPYAAV